MLNSEEEMEMMFLGRRLREQAPVCVIATFSCTSLCARIFQVHVCFGNTCLTMRPGTANNTVSEDIGRNAKQLMRMHL